MLRVNYTEGEVHQIDRACCELQSLGKVIREVCSHAFPSKLQEIKDLAGIVVERAAHVQDLLQEELSYERPIQEAGIA